jgi:putative ABC transport system ATP-binding protein
LCHAYPGGPATPYPDLDLPQGGTLLLQGPSGSGKSTWLALAAGLLPPSSGTIEVCGLSPASLPSARRDAWRALTIGLLPQRGHLSPALSVADNLSLVYVATGRRVDTDAITGALEALGLQGLARRRPHELSTGQALRAALARALLNRPKVLLADEPTSSLDDGHAQSALALLQEHAARCDATLVVATHDARARQALEHARVLALEAAP